MIGPSSPQHARIADNYHAKGKCKWKSSFHACISQLECPGRKSPFQVTPAAWRFHHGMAVQLVHCCLQYVKHDQSFVELAKLSSNWSYPSISQFPSSTPTCSRKNDKMELSLTSTVLQITLAAQPVHAILWALWTALEALTGFLTARQRSKAIEATRKPDA